MGEYSLATLRILMGLMMLWGFFDKLLGLGYETPAGQGMIDGGSPSSFVVYVTGGLFSDFYNSIAGNGFVDFTMMAAMLVIGITLTLGFASKLTTIGMCAFVLVMYSLHIPPTDNPLIDYHITWAVAMVSVYLLGGYDRISINDGWKESDLVKRFPILE